MTPVTHYRARFSFIGEGKGEIQIRCADGTAYSLGVESREEFLVAMSLLEKPGVLYDEQMQELVVSDVRAGT
jgi:hypothetical protein